MTLADRLEARWPLWLGLIVLAGGVLRLQGLGWDHGLMLHPDERNLVQAGLRLGWPDRLIPDFHAYNGLSVYPPRLLAEAIWSAPGAPEVARAARLISAALSTLAILAAAGCGRLMGGAPAALGAAFLVALNPGLIQWAHFGTSESALVLAVLVLWRIAAGFLAGETGLWRAALLSGAVLGLAMGVKTSAAAFALVPLGALLAGVRGGPVRAALASGAAALLAGAIFLASTPAIWLRWDDYARVMEFESGIVSGETDVFWTWQFTGARDVIFELRQFPALIDPFTLALAVAGIVAALVALRRRGRRAVPALLFLAGYAALVFFWHAKFIRYLAPMLGPMLVLAGWMLARIAGGFGARTARGLGVLSAGGALVWGLSFAAMYQAEDPRLQSWLWLAPRLADGDILLIEPVETGPPFPEPPPAGAFETRILPLMEPTGLDKRLALAVLLAEGDWMLISTRRHSGVLPRMRIRFPAMCGYYDALFGGRLGWEVVARFRRRAPILNAVEPAGWAEETFSVFDHPRPMVLRRVETFEPVEIAERIATAECPADRGG